MKNKFLIQKNTIHNTQYSIPKNNMKHNKQHKLLFISNLSNSSGIFETFETLFYDIFSKV